ncbi:MAG: class I SAM-dependent methyltransferase [Phycisphaeraceae bacterium]|nr:class I SAM-dependent methyltransferase [Phycisphaeraceae bacterium]
MRGRKIIDRSLRWLSRLAAGEGRAAQLCRQVKDARLTYLGQPQLMDLFRRTKELEQQNIPGAIVEAGCALGGSAIVLASAKRIDRPLRVYDVFGLIPPPGPNDGEHAKLRYQTIVRGQSDGLGGDTYYGYQNDLLGKVQANFHAFGFKPEHHNIQLVKGLFQDTLAFDQPIALAHIDCDWYDSVKVCLERIVPRLSPGGVLVIDDYDYYDSCRRAVDEFFAGRGNEFDLQRRSRLHIQRRADNGLRMAA